MKIYSRWPVLLNTVEVVKNKNSLRNCHSQEEPKEMWQLNEMYPEWDAGPGKNTLGKNGGNQVKYGLQLLIVYRYWLTSCDKCPTLA